MNFMQIPRRFARAPPIRLGVMLRSVAERRESAATAAAFAAEKIGRSADGVSCSFSLSANAGLVKRSAANATGIFSSTDA
jgi:hypothetical protein